MARLDDKLRARREQSKAQTSLSHFPVLPGLVPGDVWRIAASDGGVAKERLRDVSEGLVVVARVLLGEGLTTSIRKGDDFGMAVVGAMANALVRHTQEEWRRSLRGSRLSLGERLDRVLTRHSRQRLTSWYWATMLLGPRRAGRVDNAAQPLSDWLSDGLQVPSEVRRAREFFSGDEFRGHLSSRRAGSSEYRALEAILSRRGARDFNTGERISTRRMFTPAEPTLAVDVHHLIPRRWPIVSTLHRELQDRVDRLANLTPLAQATNIRIGNDAPASYISEFAREDPGGSEEGIDAMLKQHLIEPRLLRALSDDASNVEARVERFLDDRLTQVIVEFKALVGAT
jgi:hypothetical protein